MPKNKTSQIASTSAPGRKASGGNGASAGSHPASHSRAGGNPVFNAPRQSSRSLNIRMDAASGRPSTLDEAARAVEVIASTEAPVDDMAPEDWYLLAQRGTVTVYFLGGVEAPYIEEEMDFNTDSVTSKVRMDVGAKMMRSITASKATKS